MIVANKIDLIIDTGIRQELKDAIVSSFSTYDLVEAEKKSIEKAIHLVSAGSQEGIKDWLNACLSLLSHLVEKLVDTPVSSSIDLDSVVLPTKKHTRAQKDLLQIKDITKEKLSRLIENGYLEQKDEKYVYVREISHPDISYLTYVLPRGNDEAEIRYRRTLEKEKLLKQLERAGMKK